MGAADNDRGGDSPRGSGRLPNQPATGKGLAWDAPGGNCGECARAGEGVGLGAHVRAIVPRLHALCGVLEGHLSRTEGARGDCVVWGLAPHLWGMAAPAMGLRVVVGFGPPSFLEFLLLCHTEVPRVGPAPPAPPSLAPPRRRREVKGGFPCGFPYIVAVLADSASLTGALAEGAAPM